MRVGLGLPVLIRLAVVAALGLYVLGGCASSTPAANTGMQGQALTMG